MLERFERQHKLFEFKFDGWTPWQVIRSVVFYRLVDLPLSRPKGKRLKRMIYHSLLSVAAFIKAVVFRRKFKHLFVRMSSDYDMHGDMAKNYTLDSLIETCPGAYVIENINTWSDTVRLRKYSIAYHMCFDFFELASYLCLLFYRNKRIAEYSSQLSALLLCELNLEVDHRVICRVLSKVHVQAGLLRILLSAIKPSLALVPNTGEYALILACKKANIPYIEIQHGIINPCHPDVIPAQAGVEYRDLLLPDHMALFGDYWKEQLKNSIFPLARMHSVGRELIDRYRQQPRLEFGEQWDYIVLVTSQGLDTENFVDWLKCFVLNIPERYRVLVNIKLHPVYDNDVGKYDVLKGFDNVRLMSASEKPVTLELLASSDFHVSIASACHYDALGLGVPSFIIPLRGHEWLLHLVDNKLVFLPDSPEKLWEMMLSYRPKAIDPNYYYRPGAVGNLHALMEEVCGV